MSDLEPNVDVSQWDGRAAEDPVETLGFKWDETIVKHGIEDGRTSRLFSNLPCCLYMIPKRNKISLALSNSSVWEMIR